MTITLNFFHHPNFKQELGLNFNIAKSSTDFHRFPGADVGSQPMGARRTFYLLAGLWQHSAAHRTGGGSVWATEGTFENTQWRKVKQIDPNVIMHLLGQTRLATLCAVQ